MTVFVTGASGHIGSNLIRELTRSRRQVRALVRDDQRGIEGLDAETVIGDILDYQSLVNSMAGCDVVYHLAASISILGDKSGLVQRTNVAGTQNIVKACLEAGIKKLIHFSSIHAYCPFPGDRPVDESRAPADLRSPAYDRSKADGCRIVLDAAEKNGIHAVIIAPTAVIGPYDFKPSRMGQVLLRLHRRRFVALIDGGYDWVDARDVAKSAIFSENKATPGSQFILSGHWCSLRRLAKMIEELRGIKPPRLTIPMWLAHIAAPFSETAAKIRKRNPLLTTEALIALKRHRLISRGKAEKHLEFHPRPLIETLRDTYAWFEKQGMLDG